MIAIITIEQRELLNNVNINNSTKFNINSIDLYGNYIIDEIEINQCDIAWLKNLPLIEYTPKIIEIPVINEVNVDFQNDVYTATLNDSRVINICLENYIIELKDILEVIYVNPINTIKATFINGSVLLFNNNLTVNCMDIANENPNLFTTLSELFQNIKMSIIFKIN